MWRYLAGAASTVALIAAGFFLVRGMASEQSPIPPAPEVKAEGKAPTATPDDPLASPMRFAGKEIPPKASDFTKEEKRFNRYDKDKNGAVTREEYLTSRRKAYGKLDINGDGVLSFDEYAVKTVRKFAKADRDGSRALNRTEFSTTRVVRKTKPKPNCPPQRAQSAAPVAAPDDDAAES